jgi:hypothetical protein
VIEPGAVMFVPSPRVPHLKDIRDYLTFVSVAGILAVASTYLFRYHSDTVFGIWAGVVSTVTGIFHGLTVYDDKHEDIK